MEDLAFVVEIEASIDQAVEKVTNALKAEGFGVLTRIDVRATLQEKLGETFRPYLILGACNPPLAHRALITDGRVGLMLPCNITVEEVEPGKSKACIANPEMMIAIGDWREDPVLQEVAHQARARLERVAVALQQTD